MQAIFQPLPIAGTALAVTPYHFYVASSDEEISVIDRVTEVAGEVLKHLSCDVLHLAITTSLSHLVAVNKNGFFLWDLQKHDPNPTLTDQAEDYGIKEASSNGSLVATLHQSLSSSFVVIRNCSDLGLVRKIEEYSSISCLALGATFLLCGTKQAIVSYPLQQEGALTKRSAHTSWPVTRCWVAAERKFYYMEKNNSVCVLSKGLGLLWTHSLSSYKAIVGVTPHALILQDSTQLCYLPFQENREEADETPPHFYPFDGVPPHLYIESSGELNLDRIFVLSDPTEQFEVVDAFPEDSSEATAGFLLYESHKHPSKRTPVAAPRHQTKICGALVDALVDEAATVTTYRLQTDPFLLLSPPQDRPDQLVVTEGVADSSTTLMQDQQATTTAGDDGSFLLLETEKEQKDTFIVADDEIPAAEIDKTS